MISAVRRTHGSSAKKYLIMIMDVSSCKVFSSCCKWFELYSAGVYHTEILEKKRKKYPQTDAIYFISPSRRSVQKLIDDFSENASDSTKANPDTRS